MTKAKTTYKATMRTAQAQLNMPEKSASKIFHQPIIKLVLDTLERTVFRIIPMQIGLGASIAIGLLIVFIAYSYGYRIVSLSILGYVFALGYLVGLVFEYVRHIVTQSK